jgi:hypothetical protein
VTLPFAKALAELVPPSAVRLRRDFRALLYLVRAHALLHQASRERDRSGRVVATVADYAVVRDLVADLLAEGVEATVPAAIRETVETVVAPLGVGDGDDAGVSVARLATKLGIDKGPASRRWQQARRRGYLKNLETRTGRKARIVVDEPLPEDVELLPTPELVEERCRVARNAEGVADPRRRPGRGRAPCRPRPRVGGRAVSARLGPLADNLVALLAAEPTGLSCDQLARRLRRRRHDVLDVLRSDGRFAHEGRTRGSRWRLPADTTRSTRWDGMCGDDRAGRDCRVGRDGNEARAA